MMDWNPKANDLFLRAAEIEAEDERVVFLAEQCAGDELLRKQVESLLAAGQQLGGFLERPAGLPPTSVHPPISERPGTMIGPYKLLQELGEGGMGVVFLAEQTEPIRRQVALKVIKPGMDSVAVLARFEAERQALAMMDHPNVARIYDAGTTESGRPYFVMELIKGIPITKFCDESRMTPRQRLELFVPVCEAIQHAHQKGIIHRDIKPSNVLVCLYDGKPVPKVIDFGVAKAVEQKLTEQTLFTRVGQIVGTFEYMSPEQATMNQLDVDTRSDVYALGVLLYELLTGFTPLDKDRLRALALDEMLRAIREEEPLRPSTRLSGSGGGLPLAAAYRNTDSKKLTGLLRGELDWVVMKALEKERSRRYGTASGFAADVRRYLKDEPVEACPPTLGYRAGKYVRRHKAFISVLSALAALLLIGIATTSWQAMRATRAEAITLRELNSAENARISEAEQRAIAVDAAAEARANERKAKEQTHRAETARHALQLTLAYRAWESYDVTEAERILKEADGQFRQTWEHRFLGDLCRRTARPLTGHAGEITGVAVSGDGKVVASASTDKTVKVWDSDTGSVLFTLKGHADSVTSVAMSADGKRVVSGSDDGTVMVWDTATGKRSRTLKGHALVVKKVRVPADGAPLKFEDLLKQKLVTKEVPKGVLHVAVSADGERIVSSGADNSVKVWDGQTEKPTRTIGEFAGDVVGVALSPDGQRVVIARRPRPGAISMKAWDAKTGQELPFKQPDAHFNRFAVSPNGQRVVIGINSIVRSGDAEVWDVSTGQKMLTLNVGALTSLSSVSSLAFSADGRRIVAAGGAAWVKVLDAENGRELFTLKGHAGVEFASGIVATSADGQRIVSAIASRMRVWDLDTKPEKRAVRFNGPGETRNVVTGLAVSKRGLITGCSFRWLKAWDAATAREVLSHPKHTHSCALSADDKRLVTVDARDYPRKDLAVTFWDTATGKPISSSEGHRFNVSSSAECAFTADGKHVVLAHEGEGVVKVLDAASGQETHTIEGDNGASIKEGRRVAVAISADGRYVVRVGAGGTLTVLDVFERQPKLSIKNTGAVRRLAFSPDGRHVLGATQDGVVKMWGADDGEEKLALKGHSGPVFCVAMSPDGRWIASSGRDGTVRLWDVMTGQPKLVLKGQAFSLAISADGRLLIGACFDGVLRTWEAPLDGTAPTREE